MSKMGRLMQISCRDSATSTIMTETLDSDCLDSSGCLLTPSSLTPRFKNHSNNNSKGIVGKSATQYLLIRASASSSKNMVHDLRNSGVSTSEPVDILTIDDRFYRDFNRCTPAMIDFLRRQRSNESPIVCYESDESLDSHVPSTTFFSPDGDTPFLSVENFDLQESFLGAEFRSTLLLKQYMGRSFCKNRGSSQILLLDTQFSKTRPRSYSDDFHYPKD